MGRGPERENPEAVARVNKTEHWWVIWQQSAFIQYTYYYWIKRSHRFQVLGSWLLWLPSVRPSENSDFLLQKIVQQIGSLPITRDSFKIHRSLYWKTNENFWKRDPRLVEANEASQWQPTHYKGIYWRRQSRGPCKHMLQSLSLWKFRAQIIEAVKLSFAMHYRLNITLLIFLCNIYSKYGNMFALYKDNIKIYVTCLR